MTGLPVLLAPVNAMAFALEPFVIPLAFEGLDNGHSNDYIISNLQDFVTEWGLVSVATAPTDEEKPFYAPTRFKGTMSSANDQIDCALTVEIGSDGRIVLTFDDIPDSSDSAFLFGFFRSTALTNYCIDATSEDGDHLTSSSLYFSSMNHNLHAYRGLIGRCTNAKIVRNRIAEEGEQGSITYWLRGLRGRRMELDTALGKITAAGANRADTEKVNSAIGLEASDECVAGEASRAELIDFLDHVVYLMSFASGTMLRDPVRVFTHGDVIELEIKRHTTAPVAFYAPIDYMQQQIFFNAAVTGYFDRRAECRRLREVITYLLMGAEYTEARIMMNMIGVELVANTLLTAEEKARTTPTPYADIKSVIDTALDASTLEEADRKFVTDALGRHYSLSLEEKVLKLMESRGIANVDLAPAIVHNMILARNAIAHGRIIEKKKATKGLDTWDVLITIRELLTRVILMQLGYEGPYFCFIRGWSRRMFPSCLPV